MKRYGYCFLLFVVTVIACAMLGYALTRYRTRQEPAQSQKELVKEESDALDAESGQSAVTARPEAEQRFCLIASAGRLLILGDPEQAFIETHIPMEEFPQSEQKRLKAGIWFADLMEVYHYLESYTS